MSANGNCKITVDFFCGFKPQPGILEPPILKHCSTVCVSKFDIMAWIPHFMETLIELPNILVVGSLISELRVSGVWNIIIYAC
jgi:hypothetical protein